MWNDLGLLFPCIVWWLCRAQCVELQQNWRYWRVGNWWLKWRLKWTKPTPGPCWPAQEGAASRNVLPYNRRQHAWTLELAMAFVRPPATQQLVKWLYLRVEALSTTTVFYFGFKKDAGLSEGFELKGVKPCTPTLSSEPRDEKGSTWRSPLFWQQSPHKLREQRGYTIDCCKMRFPTILSAFLLLWMLIFNTWSKRAIAMGW